MDLDMRAIGTFRTLDYLSWTWAHRRLLEEIHFWCSSWRECVGAGGS